MAIVISKNSGLNDDLWKPIAQVLNAVLLDTDSEKTEYDKLVSNIAIEKKSKKYAEKQSSVTSLSDFAIKNEGDVAPLDDFQEGTPKLIVHNTFAKEVILTREMRDDADIDAMKTAVRNLSVAYKRTRAQYASDMLTTEGSTVQFSGKTLDKTTGDGKALFATDHPYVGKSGTQSNVFTNAFGSNTTMLNRLANIGRNFKNASGNVMGYTFDTIIIPSNVPDLEDTIRKIIKSDLTVGSNFNDVNTQKGLWKLVVDHRWQVSGSYKPYILMSSEANKELQSAMFYDRIPLTVKDWVDNKTANLEWMGRARMSASFNTWGAFIMGGAANGTELS